MEERGERWPPMFARTKIFCLQTIEINSAFTETIASPPIFGSVCHWLTLELIVTFSFIVF